MNLSGAGGPTGVNRWEEALAWHVTLREAETMDLTGALGRKWRDWCADPENRRVFDAVAALLAHRDVYRVPRLPSAAALDRDPYDLSLPIAEWLGTRASSETRIRHARLGKRWWLAGGAAIAISLIFAVFSPLLPGFRASPDSPVVYRTDVGETKNVRLRDGSTIVLGGHTAVSAAFSAKRRMMSLVEGQAWFKVAHDPHWPFVVAAGDGRVIAVGTAFVVTRESDRVVVAVTEGTVEVSATPSTTAPHGRAPGASAGPTLAAIRLSRGEELVVHDDGALSPIRPADTHTATAWTRGRLIFDGQPLRYVVETINRYSPRHIAVNAAAGALRFSGIVVEGETEQWLQSLQVIFPVTVQARGTGMYIRMRDSAKTTRTPSHRTEP